MEDKKNKKKKENEKIKEKEIFNTNLINLNEENNFNYSCTECASPIEILLFDENNNEIEFKCQKHHLKMKINEYLAKMKKYRDIKLNNDICQVHDNNKYISYCFDCNKHLCEECLKLKKHIYHYKIYIIEIKPDIKILNEIEKIINKNKIKIKKLYNKQNNK